MTQLPTALFDFVMFAKDPIHGADRAAIDALVEQRGVDFRRGQIDILRLAQQVDDALAFMWRERPRGLGPLENRRGRQFRPRLAAMEGGARQPQRGAGGGDQATIERQSRHGVHQDSSSGATGRPSSNATFFWISMTASARSNRSVRRLLSRNS